MRTFKLFLALSLLSACATPPGTHRMRAEEYVKTKKYREAILEYELHMKEREEASARAPEENPYFYYLHIGDAHLELGEVDVALDKYRSGYEKGLPLNSYLDRLFRVCAWYGARGDYPSALRLLENYRELDETLIESLIDTFHKLQVSAEEGLINPLQPTPKTQYSQ